VKTAEYASDRSQRTHRVLSGILCLILVAVSYGGWDFDIARRSALVFGLPTAGIWFAEAFALEKSDHPLAPPNLPPTSAMIRLVCWFVLLGVPTGVSLFFLI
jgi:hypothetical protein